MLFIKKKITIQNFVSTLKYKNEFKVEKLKPNEFYSKKFQTYFPKFKFFKLSDAIKNL